MNLHAMRDLNRADPLGELGPRVERKPEPAPAAPEPVGIITDADGKMRTNLPLPGNTEVPVWPFPSKPPIDDGGEGLPAEFLPVPGGGAALYKPQPLKVGDKLRLGTRWSTAPAFQHLCGRVVTVTRVDKRGRFWTSDDREGDPMGYVDDYDPHGYWDKLPPLKVGDRLRAISNYWSSDVRIREYVIDNLSEEWLTACDVTGHELHLIASIDSEGDLWERA